MVQILKTICLSITHVPLHERVGPRKHFNMPQATLCHHYECVPENLNRFKQNFNRDVKKELVDQVLEFERRLFGFNTTGTKKEVKTG